ncbi:MAG: pantetheine-phosphate adenylyltransferase [Bacteroidaceae bacterium]|nr:pantetheine-phosphate adenylyltransferase [Bacteroidaceae bacterium]
MKKAIFPGSFDPFTLGHHSIVKRALVFMDEVIIGIGINEDKRCLMSVDKRVESIRKLYADEPRVKVFPYSGLTVDFAQNQGAKIIIRGIRTVKDFEYEEGIADINRKLSGIDTVFLFSEPDFSAFSSSVVRELLHYGKDVSAFLPEGMNI